ncbi:MAG: ABC transporter permease, partial [Rhodothermales bacterium]
MKGFTLVKVATQSIWKNKMRTLLTMLGIIIGVGAVIVMVAIGQGAQSQIQEQINNLGTNMIVITPGTSNQGGVSRGAGSFNRLKLEDAEKLQRENLILSGVSPVIMTRTQVIGGQGNWRASIYGVSTDYQIIRDWDVTSGRFFDQSELRQMRKVAVLGHTIAEKLFSGEDPVGQKIQLRNVPFQVIGVLEEKGQTASGTDQDDVIIAPYTTVKNRLRGRNYIGQILASTSSPGDIPDAQLEITAIMRESHDLAAWEDDDFTV